MKAILHCLLTFHLLIIPVCASEAEGSPHDPQEERTSFSVADFARQGVTVRTAAAGTVDRSLDLPAEIRPNADRLAHIAPRFDGIVREVRKKTGDTVRAGEILAIVESDKLAPFEVQATFDGTVIDKRAVPGAATGPRYPAYVIADLSRVWVNIAVYQTALSSIEIGRPVIITSSKDGLQAQGNISYVAPIVDPVTRTATARVVLENDQDQWRPGTFVIATIVLNQEAPLVVPRRSLHTLDGQTVLFIADQESFTARPVTLGREGRTHVEITAGLTPGEEFADEGSFIVKAEMAKSSDHHHDH